MNHQSKFNADFKTDDSDSAVSPPEPRSSMLRNALPVCQPQEGSIGSQMQAFTRAEWEELKAVLPAVEFRPRPEQEYPKNMLDICKPWQGAAVDKLDEGTAQDGCSAENAEAEEAEEYVLDYFGAPRFTTQNVHEPRLFRSLCRENYFTGPTNGQCPGFLQCNLVVLPQGPFAFDFLLFCQRNPKACPLIEVCDVGSSHPAGVARGADLKTDLPK
jgi:hypothetical protein